MKLTIHTTKQDYYQFCKVYSKQITPIVMKNNTLRVLLFIFLSSLILGIYLIFKFFDATFCSQLNHLKYALILFFISFIVLTIFLGKNQQYSMSTMIDFSKTIIGFSEIELNEQGIHERKEYSQASFAWEIVNSIVKTDGHIFIFFGLGVGIILPLDQINQEIEAAIQYYCPNIKIEIYNQSRRNQ